LLFLKHMNNKTALIIGATGLVGEETLKELLQSADYSKVIALTRKPLNLKNTKLENPVVDFDKPEQYNTIKADDVFCAMGTTIGKAGSQAAFKRVDFEIPLQVAEFALKNGATKFILVSSMGVNAKSAIFYSRVKGELEAALAKLKYKALIIFRPSLLLGDRKEHRTGEAVGKFVAEKLSFLFAGPLAKYKGTPADLLARVMVKLANDDKQGVRIIENDEIFVADEK
jgi:uncharacterized protein YbjT (DUF2867 family)